MNLSFNDYTDKDYPDLREMIFCLYEEDPVGEPMTDEKINSTIRESARHPEKARIVMLNADGINVGYSILVYFWSNEYGGDIVNIDELYVKKEYRNRRIATNFIKSQIIMNQIGSEKNNAETRAATTHEVESCEVGSCAVAARTVAARAVESHAVAARIEVTPSNTAALRLYERLGFTQTSNRHMMLIHPR